MRVITSQFVPAGKTNSPSVSIIIPALNEERAIRQTIETIPLDWAEVIVVDNGSDDNTATIAKNSGAKVIKEMRKGYGYACLAGINYLRQKRDEPDLVVFLDADGSDDPRDLLRLLKAKQSKMAPDIIMGSRLDNLERNAMSPHAIVANKVFTTLINLLYKTNLTDMGPFRLMDFATLLDLEMQDTGYGWSSEMIVKALKKGYTIGEIPVTYRPRIGVSKISGSIINSLKAAIWLTIHIIRHAFWR